MRDCASFFIFGMGTVDEGYGKIETLRIEGTMDNQKVKFKKNILFARKNLLVMVLLTIITMILSSLFSGFPVALSAFVPQFALKVGILFHEEGSVDWYLIASIAYAACLLLSYYACAVLAKKHASWLIPALALFAFDAYMLVMFVRNDFNVASIVNLIFHLWVLYYLVLGIIGYYKLRQMADKNKTKVSTGETEVNPDEVWVNVYDFDKTIYRGDSSVDFYFYNLMNDQRLMKYLPKQLVASLSYKLHRKTKTQMKEVLYSYFNSIEDMETTLIKFWGKKAKKIKKFYATTRREDDIIISASPEFMLKPIMEQLNVTCIASIVDKKTSVYTGLNCYGEEKVLRLKQQFPNVRINDFYSDSLADTPLAKIAKRAFLVTGNKISPWPTESE